MGVVVKALNCLQVSVVSVAVLFASCTQTEREVSRGDTGAAAARLASKEVDSSTLGKNELLSACPSDRR